MYACNPQTNSHDSSIAIHDKSQNAAFLLFIGRSNDLENPSTQTNVDGADTEATSTSTKPESNLVLASSRVDDKSKVALSEVERAGYQFGTIVNVTSLEGW